MISASLLRRTKKKLGLMQGLSAGESPKPGSVPVAEGEVGGQVPFGGALSPSEKGYIFPIPQDKGGEKEGRTRRKWGEGRKGGKGDRVKGGGGGWGDPKAQVAASGRTG